MDLIADPPFGGLIEAPARVVEPPQEPLELPDLGHIARKLRTVGSNLRAVPRAVHRVLVRKRRCQSTRDA